MRQIENIRLALQGVMTNRFLSIKKAPSGFTLIELIVVIMIVSVMMVLMALGSGSYHFWKQEAFIRRISELVSFLHQQAVVDQSYYALKFDFTDNTYSVGIFKNEGVDQDQDLINMASDSGSLSLELAAFLSPGLGSSQTFIAPPDFPSLAEPTELPSGTVITDIKTMRGVKIPAEDEGAYVLFSPRGFSEFAVIHIRLKDGQVVTLLINPFTGLSEIYRTWKDFEWTYGSNKEKQAL